MFWITLFYNILHSIFYVVCKSLPYPVTYHLTHFLIFPSISSTRRVVTKQLTPLSAYLQLDSNKYALRFSTKQRTKTSRANHRRTASHPPFNNSIMIPSSTPHHTKPYPSAHATTTIIIKCFSPDAPATSLTIVKRAFGRTRKDYIACARTEQKHSGSRS